SLPPARFGLNELEPPVRDVAAALITCRGAKGLQRIVEAPEADETAAPLHVRLVGPLEAALERAVGRVAALLPAILGRVSAREPQVDLAVVRELRRARERRQRPLILPREQPGLRQELPAGRRRVDRAAVEPVLEDARRPVRDLGAEQELRIARELRAARQPARFERRLVQRELHELVACLAVQRGQRDDVLLPRPALDDLLADLDRAVEVVELDV